jgi:peroxiredoxin
VDTPEQSRDLCKKAGFSFPFLSDQKTEAIRKYDLLHMGAGENGHDAARARAEQFIQQAKLLK